MANDARDRHPYYPYAIIEGGFAESHPFSVRNLITGIMEFGGESKEQALWWIAVTLSQKLEEIRAKEFYQTPVERVAQTKKDVTVRATTQTLEFGDYKLPIIILEVVPDA